MRLFFCFCIFWLGLFGFVTTTQGQLINQRIDSISANQYRQQFSQPRSPVLVGQADVSHLRRTQPAVYRLDAGDTLGVFAEGVLGEPDSNPPIHYPDEDSDLGPSMGFPFVVQQDGTISLPVVNKVYVKGLSVAQAEKLVERAFLEGDTPVLNEGNRIIVSLIRKRAYSVTVIRQDDPASARLQQTRNTGVVAQRSDQSSRGSRLRLTAGENDLMNALIQTGGLPGVNARPLIRVDRTQRAATEQANQGRPYKEFPRSNSGGGQTGIAYVPVQTRRAVYNNSNVELRDGDIVLVDSKPTELYYTGGLLGGGQHLLPRDIPLDVVQAVASTGNALAGTGLIRGNVQPTELLVVRKLGNGSQVTIRVDMTRAINNPAERIQVQNGDTLILQYKPQEQLQNFSRDLFFTFGIRELFR